MSPESDLARRLTELMRAGTADSAAEVCELEALPGHAGQSYSFRLVRAGRVAQNGEKLVLRLAPEGVRIAATADVARQARIMQSLADTAVPVPTIKWFGEDSRWFGRPYFVAAFVAGDKLALGDREFSAAEQKPLARLTLATLAALHAVPWAPRRAAWGEPLTLGDEMTRLDALLERPTLDPAMVGRARELREEMRASLPPNPRIGCVHGDLNWSNCLYQDGAVRAVIDWELAQIGAVLIDLGWICLFSDRETWAKPTLVPQHVPPPAELVELYREYARIPLSARDAAWFRAFACYRFGVITAFNVMLHRRGKRPDPLWEDIALTGPRFFDRGLELLG